MDHLFYQLGTLYKNPHPNEDDALWTEKRRVFFAVEGEGGSDSEEKQENNEDKEEQEQTQEIPTGSDEAQTEVEKIASRMSEKVHGVLDVWEYEFPADVDPEKLNEARNIINEDYPDLQKLEENVDSNIAELLAEMEATESQEAQNVLWQGVYQSVPEYTKKQLRDSDHFDETMLSPETTKMIQQAIINAWKKHSGKSPAIRVIKAHAEKLSGYVKEIARNEFEMLKTIDSVREVMWDIHQTLQKQSIEQRMIRSASRRCGIPLKEGQLLEGVEISLKKGLEEDKPFLDKVPKRWRVKEVYVDKKRKPDPEDEKTNQDEMLMSGVWVAIEEKGGGYVRRMSTNRLRDFINMHDITPAVHKKKEIPENVIHLNEMGITIKAGDTLEYDEMTIDEKTNKPVANIKKVKVLSVDDHGVKLSEKVLLRRFYDSPDLAQDEYENDLTLGEFVKWMNQCRPVPTMRFDALRDRLRDHYNYMNKQYRRNKNCHLPIMLDEGEILHADAPGNPLFEVESVDEANGIIQLKNSRSFTFPQFLRWVYENDIEPYDPELEALKMKTYFNAGKKAINRAKKDAEETIEHYKKTGIWRDTLKKLREKGLKGIFEPDVPTEEQQETSIKRQSYSRIAQWLRDTQWLRLDDIFEIFKSGWEYYVRNWRRRQKARYSAIGKNVPWFGTEFERINQHAETEEVGQFKDAMDQWGIPQIEKTLYATNNQDQAKACFNVLAEKGMLRWDDKRLYHAINKFADINHKLPIPAGDPYKQFGKGAGKFNGEPLEGKNVMDFLQDALDSIWGEGSYTGWKRQNDGAIENAIQQSYNKGEELENDPKNVGGISKELSNLMTQHMYGDWVDPTEFEGLLRFIIEAGKASGKDKIYYLLMGIGAKNPQGRTILGWERIGRFVSKYANQFPALDFFSSTNSDSKRNFQTGEFLVDAKGNTRSFIRSDFEGIIQNWVSQGRSAGFYAPGDDAEKFLQINMLTTDAVQNRLEKGIRNAQNMDHDDSPYYIPALKESEMESICASTGGDTKKFTIQGYKNGYVGFGLRMKALVDKYEEEKNFEQAGGIGFSKSYLQKLVTSFKSYIIYDGILDNRYRKKREFTLQRLQTSDYQTGCVWDANRPLRRYQDEMKLLIREIATAYGQGDNPNIVELPFKKGAKEDAIENFGTRFEKMVRDQDDGAKLVKIINKHKFLIQDSVGSTTEDLLRSKARMHDYDPETVNANNFF